MHRKPKQPKFDPKTASVEQLWFYGDRDADFFDKYRTVNRTAAATLAGTVVLSALTKNTSPAEVMAFGAVMSVGLYATRASIMNSFRVLTNPLKRTKYSRPAYGLGADVTSAALPLAATTAADFIGRSIDAPTPTNIIAASLASVISGASIALDRWTGKNLRYQVEHVGETPQPLPKDAYVHFDPDDGSMPDFLSQPEQPSNFQAMMADQNPAVQQVDEDIFVDPPVWQPQTAPRASAPVTPPLTVSPSQLGHEWHADS